MCDRIAVMYLGKIVEIGPAEAVLQAPAHPYARLLRASVPAPDPDIRQDALTGADYAIPDAGALPRGCAFHERCPHVMDICRSRVPALLPLADAHEAACYLYGGSG
jgi:oligopeptide/dipeptide ABC transporter ATP-binding protein